jgi:hypothetical protein
MKSHTCGQDKQMKVSRDSETQYKESGNSISNGDRVAQQSRDDIRHIGISEQTANVSPNRIKRSDFVIELKCFL